MNLTIDRVSRTHAGQYACTATNYNKAHTSTGTPVLVVYCTYTVKPVIDRESAFIFRWP